MEGTSVEGTNHDEGKDPWHLAPWDAFRAIVKVMAYGAKEEGYEARNWERGLAWSRHYSSLMRHLTAFWEREPADPKSGFSHLWHAGCRIVFLISYEIRGIGKDDRPQKTFRLKVREKVQMHPGGITYPYKDDYVDWEKAKDQWD